MRKFTILLCLFIAFGVHTSLYAATTQSARIVFVDLQGVFKRSSEVTHMLKQLEGKRKTFQASLVEDEKRLKAEEKQLIKQKKALSKEAFDAKSKAFKAKVGKAQRRLQERKAQLDRAYSEAFLKVQKKAYTIIEGLAAEKGFDIAISNAGVLFSSKQLDISKEVLDRLNKHLPKVDIEIKDVTKKKS